ncbi:hypothetical protein LTR36_008707 [Oleoguttula mirabilis]|uniref:Uncharacterized protein n=1 Tax=Oleoguttula mirabilis TaxID=1507867 RepID=A0AAV9JTV1_9PEZI|nr:hypothetical protein LTR36_008707 [Oleoguttula mirabilis]
MAATDAVQARLHACISAFLREEWSASRTSHVNQAASAAAHLALGQSEDFAVSGPSTSLTSRQSSVIASTSLQSPRPTAGTEVRTVRYKAQLEEVQQPAITRTCRQLRRETLSMYYSLNHFKTFINELRSFKPEGAAVNKWLVAMGKDNSKHILHLTVYLEDDDGRVRDRDIKKIMSSNGLRLVKGVAKSQVLDFVEACSSSENVGTMRAPGGYWSFY